MVTLSQAYRGAQSITIAGQALSIAVRQVTNPSRVSLIAKRMGLEEADAILEARLVSPRRIPTAVKAGVKGEFTWAGRKGVVTVQPMTSAIPTEWRDRYGDRLVMAWVSDEP